MSSPTIHKPTLLEWSTCWWQVSRFWTEFSGLAAAATYPTNSAACTLKEGSPRPHRTLHRSVRLWWTGWQSWAATLFGAGSTTSDASCRGRVSREVVLKCTCSVGLLAVDTPVFARESARHVLASWLSSRQGTECRHRSRSVQLFSVATVSLSPPSSSGTGFLVVRPGTWSVTNT